MRIYTVGLSFIYYHEYQWVYNVLNTSHTDKNDWVNFLYYITGKCKEELAWHQLPLTLKTADDIKIIINNAHKVRNAILTGFVAKMRDCPYERNLYAISGSSLEQLIRYRENYDIYIEWEQHLLNSGSKLPFTYNIYKGGTKINFTNWPTMRELENLKYGWLHKILNGIIPSE